MRGQTGSQAPPVALQGMVSKKAEAKVVAEELADLTNAAVAEVIGHTCLLYKPSGKRIIPL